jgi:SAM-dependent methyltransferase
MAPVYDAFTSPYDYELWTGAILGEVTKHGVGGRRLLDVACGTGKSFLPMLEWGWEVTGCDISPSMLAIAGEKAGEEVPLAVADVRELPKLGEFDLVWALGDSLNYLLAPEEFEMALIGMSRNLAPGGLLVFDLNTIYCYRTFFAETQALERGGLRFIWWGQASPQVAPGSVCESLLELEPDDDRESDLCGVTIPAHRHRQRHFPAEEVLGTLDAVRLECLDVIGQDFNVLRRPLDELTHTKAVYVTRQAGASNETNCRKGHRSIALDSEGKLVASGH